MIEFLNNFFTSSAYRFFMTWFDSFRRIPIVIKTFYSLMILSFVIYIIRRILFGR